MKVEGTPYDVMLTSNGYHVMRNTRRPAVTGGAPIMLSVAGPFITREEAVSFAELDDLEELEGEDEGVPDCVLIAMGLA